AESAVAGRSLDGAERSQPGQPGRGTAPRIGKDPAWMLSFSGSLKVFVAVEPCDMRKGFNGLHTAVTERLGEDPKGGALFVFCNRRHNRLKILYWDGTGLWVLTKRHVSHCPV